MKNEPHFRWNYSRAPPAHTHTWLTHTHLAHTHTCARCFPFSPFLFVYCVSNVRVHRWLAGGAFQLIHLEGGQMKGVTFDPTEF